MCLLGDSPWPEDAWLHAVSGELALPMTAFARPCDGDRVHIGGRAVTVLDGTLQLGR